MAKRSAAISRTRTATVLSLAAISDAFQNVGHAFDICTLAQGGPITFKEAELVSGGRGLSTCLCLAASHACAQAGPVSLCSG